MSPDIDIDVPWLAPQIERLRQTRTAGRFPPAVLIHDQGGAGGLWLARYAAQLALCRAEQPPCGQCRDCRLFLTAQHPDFLSVGPIDDSKVIRVEQIRELTDELVLTAHGGGATAVLIHPADTMNANAANALLKTLEEPRAGVTLLLVANTPSRLPATVLSRCQRLRVTAPSRAQSLAWLERHRGAGPWPAVLDAIGEAPFDAAELDPVEASKLASETFSTLSELARARASVLTDIPALAERWAKADSFELRLTCIETWLTACIDHASGGPRQLQELRTGAHLPESSSDMNIAALLRLLDGAYELRALRLTSINRSLALEELLWRLARSKRQTAAAS
jgi:DNA polymerase III subunit delta'